MASVLKVLFQSNPSAATLTDGYTVPASTSTVVSTITLCNRSTVPTTFRIAVAPAGAANDNKHYLAYDAPIGGNELVTFTLGLTLAATDVVRLYATLATLSFGGYGEELS